MEAAKLLNRILGEPSVYDCRVSSKTATSIHLDRGRTIRLVRIRYNICAI